MKNRRFVFVMLLMLAMTSGAEEKSRQITVSLNQHDADYAKENNLCGKEQDRGLRYCTENRCQIKTAESFEFILLLIIFAPTI